MCGKHVPNDPEKKKKEKKGKKKRHTIESPPPSMNHISACDSHTKFGTNVAPYRWRCHMSCSWSSFRIHSWAHNTLPPPSPFMHFYHTQFCLLDSQLSPFLSCSYAPYLSTSFLVFLCFFNHYIPSRIFSSPTCFPLLLICLYHLRNFSPITS